VVDAGRVPRLGYTPFERLPVPRPVRRLPFVVARCRGRAVLDLGCHDETAAAKQGTDHWAHGQIARVARTVLGVDSSPLIPAAGIATGPAGRIVRGDVMQLAPLVAGAEVEVVVAGELIEHLGDALGFLTGLRQLLPGRELIATTPNATSLTNVAGAALARESTHADHLQVYSYKTLNTLAARAGFTGWDIVPYHVTYAETALRARGPVRAAVGLLQAGVNAAEALFPLLSGGLILHVPHM
jgi:trans-aconitate methyltransferase